MPETTQTIGEQIAAEFSRDKVHLTATEQRRLGMMIDMKCAPLLDSCEAARDAIGVALAKIHDQQHIAISPLENAREMLRETISKADGE